MRIRLRIRQSVLDELSSAFWIVVGVGAFTYCVWLAVQDWVNQF